MASAGVDGLVYPKKGTLHTPDGTWSSGGMQRGDGVDSPTTDYMLKALGGVKRWESSTPSSPSSPGTPTGRSRSPFARAARRAAASSPGAAPYSPGSRTTPPRQRRPPGGNTSSQRTKKPTGSSVVDTFDELSADFGDFLDENFLEILYGIAIAMLLVVLVTSGIARAYIPPYKGWDSERRIYVAASWYSGGALVIMILLPLFGPMLYNGFLEFQKVSEKSTSKQKAALRAFRKGYKTGVVFYDRIGDRARGLLGLPPMQTPLRSRLCV